MIITIELGVHYAIMDIIIIFRRKLASLLRILNPAYNYILTKKDKLYAILKREGNLEMRRLQLSMNVVHLYFIASNVFNIITWYIAVYVSPCITSTKRLGYVTYVEMGS